VGSINGSEASNKVNRELALQVGSDEAYEYLRGVFEYDWQASQQSSPHAPRAYLPLVARHYVPPADHLVISELLYDPVGVADADGEWIEIYNPTAMTVTLTSYRLSDGDSYGDGTAAFPGGSLPPGGVILIAQRADAFRSTYGFPPDFELKDSDPAVPNMTPVKGGIGWGNSGDEAILRDPAGAQRELSGRDAASWCQMGALAGAKAGRPGHRRLQRRLLGAIHATSRSGDALLMSSAILAAFSHFAPAHKALGRFLLPGVPCVRLWGGLLFSRRQGLRLQG
jgi:hypothetical protein